MNVIRIRTLGELSLTVDGKTICDLQTRSRKVWSILAYLIQYRDTSFSQQRLIELFWGSDSSTTNPENALRITMYRLRALLDQLWPGAGRELILYRDSSYCWNETVPVSLDCEEFENLCHAESTDDNTRLASLLSALSLYRGVYLPRQSSELWAVPLSAHFSNLFLSASMEAAELLMQQGRHQEAIAVCRTAALSEPYQEQLHGVLIRALAASGDSKTAAAVYEDLSHRLFDEFGIYPGEDLRNLYHSIAGAPENRTLPIEEIMEQIQETPGKNGAMQCDYDYFKVLCYAQSRSLERTGGVTHVALLRISSDTKKPSRQFLNRIMDRFADTLRQNLRRGDVISRCSTCQYIIMLPDANYENSCMVCRRVIAAFHRSHPHISAKIQFMVQPLTPGTRVP